MTVAEQGGMLVYAFYQVVQEGLLVQAGKQQSEEARWNGMEWNDSQSIISDSERQNKWGTLCESMLVLVYFVLYTKASLALSLDHCFFMNDARYYGLRRGASLAPRVLFCMYCL
jgi:hypothetical protein